MRIVLDTNCLYYSLFKQGEYYSVWRGFVEGKYTLCLSTDIIEEYHEILSRYTTPDIAQAVVNTLLNARNVELITVFYKWNLIEADYDDNKFSDCAIASNAKYIVSNDKHFNGLKKIDFPHVSLLSLSEFKSILASKK